jgi:hypothetical protein
VFAGTELLECVASFSHARVLHLAADGAGAVVEREMPVRLLADALAPSRDRRAESYGVSELRALRAGRQRWE